VSHPFNTSLRRGTGEPRDLLARVDAEVRERIGEAVDFVCLESMVAARRTSGSPAPVADSQTDRAEFDRRVETFLTQLENAMLPALDTERRRSLTDATRAAGDRLAQLLATQVTLAKLLPDYWQRFEEVRISCARNADTPASRRDRASWLDRLFGR
jgi:hypothetical protein